MMIGIIQIVSTLILSNVMPIKVGNYEIWSVKMDSVTEEKVLHNNWGPDMDVLTCSTLCLKDSDCNSFALKVSKSRKNFWNRQFFQKTNDRLSG